MRSRPPYPSIRHLDGDVENLIGFPIGLAADPLLSGLTPSSFLHDNEGCPAVVFDVVDGTDARMVQL